MLQNDVAGMDALDVSIRTTETYLNALKERMGGVLGACFTRLIRIFGKKNQEGIKWNV